MKDLDPMLKGLENIVWWAVNVLKCPYQIGDRVEVRTEDGVKPGTVTSFMMKRIDDRAFLRASWLFIDTEYTGGFFGAPDPDPASGQPPHGGTAPPVNPTGQTLHALSLTLHAGF